MTIGEVRTQYGRVRGAVKQSYAVYRGIPYATPPVDGRRWRAPARPDAWEGVRPAVVFGSRCTQGSPIQPGSLYHKEFYNDDDFIPPMSEDCLYLNVWTPAVDRDEHLPVAVWIHGGAFSGGCGSEMEFDGAAYCERGVILVTINYRLGPIGFLAHPELSAESPSGVSGNYGILDQIAALEWVQENIESFGGDPSRVMVFGQSAGAMSVQTLVSSTLTRGMVASAIMQSGGGLGGSLSADVSLADAEAQGIQFAGLAGLTSIEDLRRLSAAEIVELGWRFSQQTHPVRDQLLFAPCVDGYVMQQGYDETVLKGAHDRIPYILGSTANDIKMTPEMIARGEKSDLYYSTIRWSLQDEKLGRTPDHVYYFTREPLGDDAGAFHSCDLWYMFGTLGRSWRPKDEHDADLSRRMLSYWTNFAKCGDPNGPDVPVWEVCSAANETVLELG